MKVELCPQYTIYIYVLLTHVTKRRGMEALT